MEEAPARRYAAAGGFFIPGEGDVHHFRMLLPQAHDFAVQVFPLFFAGGQFLTFLRDRHELHKDHSLAAPVGQALQEGAGGNLLQVFRGHGDGRAEDQPAPIQLVHVGDQLVIDAAAPPGVGDFPFALDAHDGQKVSAFVKQRQILLIHEGAVGEDGEKNIGLFTRRFDDVLPQHGFAAGQQDKADAQFVRLVKDAQPFFAGQLLHRGRVHRGMVAAGIAARAVQVALAGDAGDEERGNMLPSVLGLAAYFAGGFAGRGEPGHKHAFLGVFQGRLDGFLHHPLHAMGHIFLNIKCFFIHILFFSPLPEFTAERFAKRTSFAVSYC